VKPGLSNGKNILRVSENRVLRRIFGHKREAVTGGWRRLHNVELHNLYTSPDTIREIKMKYDKMSGHVASMEEMGNA
jgi:hypothetical protein